MRLIKKKPIKNPLQPKVPHELLPTPPESLKDEDLLVCYQIDELDYTNQVVNFVALDTCRVSKTLFINSTLKSFEVQDTIFDHCDFSNTEMIGSSFHRVIFKNCKLTGANFAEGMLVDCQFIDCVADFSTFSYTNLKIVSFTESSLRESDFFEMKWQHLQFDHCELTASSWFNTSLAGLNLANSSFEKLAFSQELLRGLTINQEQAITIALGMGINIDEPL